MSMEPSKDDQRIKDPITDDTHLVDRVHYLQDGPTNMDPVSPESESLDKEDLGLLAGEASPKA